MIFTKVYYPYSRIFYRSLFLYLSAKKNINQKNKNDLNTYIRIRPQMFLWKDVDREKFDKLFTLVLELGQVCILYLAKSTHKFKWKEILFSCKENVSKSFKYWKNYTNAVLIYFALILIKICLFATYSHQK